MLNIKQVDTNCEAVIYNTRLTWFIFFCIEYWNPAFKKKKTARKGSGCYSFTPIMEKKEWRPHWWNPTTCNDLML